MKVVACRGSVTDHATHLKGQQPRGWRAGRTWDEVAGAYLPDRKQVVIATEARGHDRAVATAHGSADMVAHEAGHALDHLANGIQMARFMNARDKDKGALTAYELQPGEAGLSETWAESFARFMAGKDSHTPALHQFWLDYLGNSGKVHS